MKRRIPILSEGRQVNPGGGIEFQDNIPPSIPTGLASSNITASSFSVSWAASTDNVGVTGYDVFINDIFYASTATTSISVTGRAASTTYRITVRAKDLANNLSAFSSVLSVTTNAVPDTQAPTVPVIIGASSVTTTSATINWSPSTDNVAVDGYFIYVNGVRNNVIPVVATSYNLTGLSPSTTYSITVSAIDVSSNESTQSTVYSLTTSNPVVGSFSAVASVTGENTVAITFDFGDAFSNNITGKKLPSYYVWAEGNYGFTITHAGLNDIKIENLSVSSNVLTLTLATSILEGETINIVFNSNARSPRRATGTSIPTFNVNATRAGTLAGTKYYVSPTGSASNNGTSISTPWSLARLNSTVTASGSVIYFLPGLYTGTLVPRSNHKYICTSGYAEIYGNGAAKVCEAVVLNNLYFRGIYVRNFASVAQIQAATWGYQGFEIRACANVFFYNCKARWSSNGFFIRGRGAQFKVTNIVIKGCYSSECWNAPYFIEGNDENNGLWRIDNITFGWNEGHSVYSNDIAVFHAQSDGSQGSVGKIGGNNRIYGNNLYQGNSTTIEELLDLTALSYDGVDSYVEDNYLHDTSSSMVAMGWTAGYIHFRNNYLVSETLAPVTYLYARVNDVKIYNNIFTGRVTGFAAGNQRAMIMLVGSGTIASENPERVKIFNNTFAPKRAGSTAVNSSALVFQILSIPGRPNPVDCEFKNNLIVSQASDGLLNSIIEFSDLGIFSPASSGMDINHNLYAVASSSTIYELGDALNTLAQFQATYNKDLNSTYQNSTSNILTLTGTGPERYKPGSAMTKLGTTLPVYITTDFEGTARTTTKVGAYV